MWATNRRAENIAAEESRAGYSEAWLSCAAVLPYRVALGRPRAPWLGHGPLPLLGGLVVVGWSVGALLRRCAVRLGTDSLSTLSTLAIRWPFAADATVQTMLVRRSCYGFSYCLAASDILTG